MLRKYWSPVMLGCYDDDAAAAEAAAAEKAVADKAAADKAAADAAAGKGFTQDQVNKFLAEDRRKNEAKFKTEKKAELEKQSADYQRLSEHTNLTEQERDEYKTKHAEAEAQLAEFRTKEETLRREKKQIEEQLTGKLTTAEKRAKDWETRYQESHVKRELQDAAVKGEAFSPQQMVNTLRPYTTLVPVKDANGKDTGEYQVMVALDEGNGTVTQLSPEAAMKRMKELPELYGNLFKANVVSGVGSTSSTAGTAGNSGPVDRNLSQDEYRKHRKEILAGARVIK